MTCPNRYMDWWRHRCDKDTKPCSTWRLAWCKGYTALIILVLAVGLYFGIGLARAYDRTQNQIIFTEGSLEEYHKARKRSGLIGGCYGWSEKYQKYMVWNWDSAICQRILLAAGEGGGRGGTMPDTGYLYRGSTCLFLQRSPGI